MKKLYDNPTQMIVRLDKPEVEKIKAHAAFRNEGIVDLVRRGVMNQIAKEKPNEPKGSTDTIPSG